METPTIKCIADNRDYIDYEKLLTQLQQSQLPSEQYVSLRGLMDDCVVPKIAHKTIEDLARELQTA